MQRRCGSFAQLASKNTANSRQQFLCLRNTALSHPHFIDINILQEIVKKIAPYESHDGESVCPKKVNIYIVATINSNDSTNHSTIARGMPPPTSTPFTNK